MIPIAPPLLLLHQPSDEFVLSRFLSDLADSDSFEKPVFVNDEKYQNLDLIELLFEGIAFVITHHDVSETEERFALDQSEMIFCERPIKDPDCIGISLGENVAGAERLGPVNRSLLRLACLIGEAVEATEVCWTPAGIRSGLGFFQETTKQYSDGGPFPVLIQVRMDEQQTGAIHTFGLKYFAGQEVRLRAPEDYLPGDTMKRLVRIVHDIATNGKVETEIDTNGIVPGETLSFRPSEDLSALDVTIANDAKVQSH